jgi:hypothetical protein
VKYTRATAPLAQLGKMDGDHREMTWHDVMHELPPELDTKVTHSPIVYRCGVLV